MVAAEWLAGCCSVFIVYCCATLTCQIVCLCFSALHIKRCREENVSLYSKL